ncbi:MAG: hypothetical protein IKA61_05725 [Clostridia bacterium]|nr:hypothetical protein [Clostridia bacterium]
MRFKYKFSNAFKILFVAIYLLAIACFTWNLIRLINSLSSEIAIDTYGYISIALCLLLPIVISVFVTAILISSDYTVQNGKLIVKFGLMSDKYSVKEIENIVKNVKTDVLVVNFKDESTLRVVIDKRFFDDFSATVIKENKDVCYGETDEVDNNKGKNA